VGGQLRERAERPPPARQRAAFVALERGQFAKRHSLQRRGAGAANPRDQRTAFGNDDGLVMRQQVRRIAHQAGDAHGVAMIRRPQCGETVAQRVAAGARLAASRSWPGAACGIRLVGRPPRCRGRSRCSRSVGVFGGGQRHPSAPARKQDRSSSRVRFTRQAVFFGGVSFLNLLVAELL